MTWACPQNDLTPDPSSWGARNRVQLYPGKVQTWVLGRAVDRDHPSNAELRNMARAVMAKWFSDTPIVDFFSRSGAADLIDVGQVSSTPIELPHVLQHWTQLPGPLPLLKPGKVLYVPVSFVWRSESLTSKAWPTWRVNWGAGGPCSIEADWMLIDVGGLGPGDLPAAPPETTVAEDLNNLLHPGPWVGAGLLIVSAAYLINALKR